tara:strand:+ start:7918 stop:8238 length:321 start_codon:yes stop_codon:yes gene_type:complete
MEMFIAAPALVLFAALLLGFTYYFTYQIVSQYYSYQWMLCSLEKTPKTCEQVFLQETRFFSGIQKHHLKTQNKESAKAYKVRVQWMDRFFSYDIKRSNSVYVPKKL